jgi:hypothetical protein
MKDIYKNPFVYYIVALIVAVLWPAVIWGIYLPASQSRFKEDKNQFEKAQPLIEELLVADPERLNFNREKGKSTDFDYASAVQQTAEFCSILSASYKLSSAAIVTSKGQKSQSANISLKDVDITKATRFLSTIQLRWAGLQCTKISLKKNKGVPDSWDVDFTFKYYY